jgi:hypothetical protein
MITPKPPSAIGRKHPFANSCLRPKPNHFPVAIGGNKVITRSQLALSPSLKQQSQGIPELLNAALAEGQSSAVLHHSPDTIRLAPRRSLIAVGAISA